MSRARTARRAQYESLLLPDQWLNRAVQRRSRRTGHVNQRIFSVKQNLRSRHATAILRFAAAQLTRTVIAKNSPDNIAPTFSPTISIRLRLINPSFTNNLRLPLKQRGDRAARPANIRIAVQLASVFRISPHPASFLSFSRRACITARPFTGFYPLPDGAGDNTAARQTKLQRL